MCYIHLLIGCFIFFYLKILEIRGNSFPILWPQHASCMLRSQNKEWICVFSSQPCQPSFLFIISLVIVIIWCVFFLSKVEVTLINVGFWIMIKLYLLSLSLSCWNSIPVRWQLYEMLETVLIITWMSTNKIIDMITTWGYDDSFG